VVDGSTASPRGRGGEGGAADAHSPLESIGGTPLITVEGVFVKLECANPGGSVKDRIARFLLGEAARRGELHPGDTVVECTSGNTGIALAWVGRQLGYRVLIFMPEHMSRERLRMLEQLGAEVRLTPKAIGFAGAIELRDAYRGRPGYYVSDQFANQDNSRCHSDTTGAELVAQLRARGRPRVGCFVAGVGTGGTLMGIGRALRAVMPEVQRVAVEPEESAVLSGGPPGDHGIMGIGDGFVPPLVDMTEVDQVIRVGTDEAHAAAERIRRDHGYCVGRSSGANLVAALRLKAQGATVATVFPDCANRYVSLGLEPPGTPGVRCAMGSLCAARTRTMLDG
jgi:cysteine synthase A